MIKKLSFVFFIIASLLILFNGKIVKAQNKITEKFTPLSYEQADAKADSVLKLMTMDEKVSYVGGDKKFFIRAIPRLNLNEVYMSDATQGIHIRKTFGNEDLSNYQLEKSTAFPCPIALAATWNPDLAYDYAESIGEECRAGGIGVLLGPGMNNYRQAQCGRNFEYFGEDPFLASRMIEKYVEGIQSTGTIATLKHFVANNTDYYRRRSNSIVDERELHEINLPAFKAGIDAGAKAVMTSYNQLNGEWCGQSEFVINDLLRKQLEFKWLIMTDWWSVYDGVKVANSGQDLEMPGALALKDLEKFIDEGKVKVEKLDNMVKNILRTYFAMKLDQMEKDNSYLDKYPQHESTALQTAREAIVLLKNEEGILPLKQNVKNILVTGDFVKEIAAGGGSAAVVGYEHKQMLDELVKIYGDKIHYYENPTSEEIKSADVILCSVGTKDAEGLDRAFELPEDQEQRVMNCVNNNPNTIVIVFSGSGIRMTDWNDKAKAIIYSWYIGQNGNTALAEIIAGITNPSGKLPITIEKEFKDSPGYGYIPAGEELYFGQLGDNEYDHPIFDIPYNESIFVGYRWYEHKNIEPLYHFGYGLSYSSFELSGLTVTKEKFNVEDVLTVSLNVKNTGDREGMEVVQLYVSDEKSSLPRPIKELKGFKKVNLKPGESTLLHITIDKHAFEYWNPEKNDWIAEKGKFFVNVGTASNNIILKKEIELL